MTMDFASLLRNAPVLFDGATGTEYQRRGLPVGAAPEQWVMERPDDVTAVHRAYIDAGARIIETCTFGATRRRLDASGLSYGVEEVTARAVALARQAADGRALVAGSVGPFGAVMEPYGDVPAADVEALFSEQAAALVAAGADIVLIETMISLDEAVTALRAAKRAGAAVAGVTMTFELIGGVPRTSFGETVREAAERLAQEGASFVGANCGAGFELMRMVASEFRIHASVPVLIQTNAGIPIIENGAIRYPENAESFGAFASELAALGVPMIGGCCGTSPEHIAEARRRLGG